MRKALSFAPAGREHLDRWLVSYADYMTLIFALFVVLYSVAIVNKEVPRRHRGMTRAFNQVPRNYGLLEGQGKSPAEQPGVGRPPCWRAGVAISLAGPITGTPVQQDGTALATIDLQLQQAMGALVDAGVVKLAKDDDWLTVELSSGLLFSSGSAFLGSNAGPVLDTLSGILKPVDNYVRGAGFTDNQPINNEIFRSNWTPSAARAEAVLTALVGKGIAQSGSPTAYGEFSPFADNGSEQGRLQNRKVVVAISRFAWVPPATVKPLTGTPVQDELQSVDSENVRVVTLPGGGIRITTRQD